MERSETPAIGTTEAAVRSCVSLMAAVFGQSEDLIAYWLDLYFQVRSAYEREQRQDQPAPLRVEEVYTLIREILHEELAAVAVVPLAGIRAEEREDGGPEIVAPEVTDPMELAKAAEKEMGRRARAMGSQDAGDGTGDAEGIPYEKPRVITAQEAAEAETRAKDPAPEKPAPALRGWAAKKNQIRNRLLLQRKKGVTIAEIVNASEGAVTEKEIIRILNAEKVPTETYKRLEAALAAIER